MKEKKTTMAESLVLALEDMSRSLQRFFSRFLDRTVEFIEDAGTWILDTVKRIGDYLGRFFSALFELAVAFGKLFLFYIPALICAALFVGEGSWIWAVLAALWGIGVTLIGLTYRRRGEDGSTVPTEAPESGEKPLTSDEFREFVKQRFPTLEPPDSKALARIWYFLSKEGYCSAESLDRLLCQTEDARLFTSQVIAPKSGVDEIDRALAFTHTVHLARLDAKIAKLLERFNKFNRHRAHNPTNAADA